MKTILKLLGLLFLSATCVTGCKKDPTSPVSSIEVNAAHRQFLDSLIIYDKHKSWEIKSVIRFKASNRVVDTMTITETKYYQIYSFIDGKQGELGELVLAPNSDIHLSIDENNLFETVDYSGQFKASNNFLAFFKNHQNQLSELVRKGVDQSDLDIKIHEKGILINEKGIALNVPDSLRTYVSTGFDAFSDILKQKNMKYQYKASLIGQTGNNFTFKDINNKLISLEDLENKYVYIDVWATWCKPCKVEYPYLKQLEAYFSNQDDIQIVSISTDRDFEKWATYVTENAMEGMQLYSGSKSDFVEFYDIGALPRFLFLDREGKIINPEELRPSDPELLKNIKSTMNDNRLGK